MMPDVHSITLYPNKNSIVSITTRFESLVITTIRPGETNTKTWPRTTDTNLKTTLGAYECAGNVFS